MSNLGRLADHGKGHVRALVRRVRIRNFKSIKSLDLKLEPGVNVLVGANASGKTNILEAIHFLYKALIDSMGKIPYRPHAPEYWSPTDIIYQKNPENPVSLGIDIEYYWPLKGDKDKWEPEWLALQISFDAIFTYEPAADTIMPAEYKLTLNYGMEIRLTNEGIKVYLSKRLVDEIGKAANNTSSEDDNVSRVRKVLTEISKVYKMHEDSLVYESKWQIPPSRPLTLNLASPIVSDIVFRNWVLVQWALFPGLEKGIPLAYPLYYKKVHEPSGVDLGLPGVGITPAYHIGVVKRTLEKIVLLKHPDTGVLSEPVPFYGSDRLDVRARNLAELLLALQGKIGGFPERLHRALSRMFPGVDLRVESRFGRVALVGVEDGLLLPPASLPDGLVKLVALMVAVEQNPSILLVDELENSMHARLLEFVVDELNSLGAPVLATTHSPIVVDLVGPERVLIVEKHPDKGTVVKRVSDHRELLQRLREEGIALSDHVFYSATWRD